MYSADILLLCLHVCTVCMSALKAHFSSIMYSADKNRACLRVCTVCMSALVMYSADKNRVCLHRLRVCTTESSKVQTLLCLHLSNKFIALSAPLFFDDYQFCINHILQNNACRPAIKPANKGVDFALCQRPFIRDELHDLLFDLLAA